MLIVSTVRGKYRLLVQHHGREETVEADASLLREWVQGELTRPYPARIRLNKEQAERLLEHLRAAV